MRRMFFFSGLVAAFGVMAGELYVDDDAAAGGNGSQTAPFKTIQEAVDAAADDDTIYVLPGVYDQGGKTITGSGTVNKVSTPYSQNVRVYISNKNRLRIVSTGGREVTHIVGVPGNGMADVDGQSGATMCIYVAGDRQVTFEGFTLRDGCCCQAMGRAGGIAVNGNYWTTNYYTLAYSTVSNCVGPVSACYGGVIIGTYMANNTTRTYGDVYMATLYNCVITGGRNGGAAIRNCARVVNTTVANNYSGYPAIANENNVKEATGQGLYYNCAFFGNNSQASDKYGIYRQCFLDGDTCSNASENVTLQNVKLPYTNVCMSVVMGDMRPIAGGRLDGMGNNAYTQFDEIPAEYRRRDFDGKPLAADFTVPLGAILSAATPASCGLWINQIFRINGRAMARAYLAHYTENWPASAFVQRGETTSCSNLVSISINKYAGETTCYNYYLGINQGHWISMAPYQVVNEGTKLTAPIPVYAQSSDLRLYVDCNLGDYAGHDGTSWEKAFKTIQEAVDAAGKAQKAAYVRVKGGIYDEGGNEDETFKAHARVVVPANYDKHLLVEAVDGPENTFIVGAPDPDTLKDATNPGIGPKAYRCVITRSFSCGFAGFTLTNGHAHTATAGSNNDASGGGFYATTVYAQLNDGAITGCRAVDAAASRCGTFLRVRFAHNFAKVGVSRGGKSYGCLYYDNYKAGATYDGAINDQYLYNCTCHEPNATQSCCSMYNNAYYYNTVFVAGGAAKDTSSTTRYRGNVVHPYLMKSIASALREVPDYVLLNDPFIGASEAAGFKPLSTSPVFTAGTTDFGSRPCVNALNLVCDFENNSVIAANGQIVAGAVTEPHEAVCHYVSPAGDDANNGLTEATAKQTLKAAMEDETLWPGEEVVALPGTYKLGSQIHTEIVETSYPDYPITIRSRVCVPTGTTLRSRDGAATTIIEGAAATQDADALGCGPDAIRCAMVEDGAYLKGFTLRDGHVASKDGKYHDDVYGGGVLGRSVNYAFVEDCIITNNFAPDGAGGNHAVFTRCQFLDNTANHFASAVRHGRIYNCFFDGNHGPRTTECLYDVVNCTYGNNYGYNSTSGTEVFQNMSGCEHLVNTVVYGVASGGNQLSTIKGQFANCVFPREFKPNDNGYPAQAVNIVTNLSTSVLNALYAGGRPLMATNLVVDAGVGCELAGDVDVAGEARVKNGAIDIGAFEYDWKGDYAAALGDKVTVTDETGVVETDGQVTLVNGATLAADWAGRTGRHTVYEIAATLNGAGSLVVLVNGETLGTLTESGTLHFANKLAVNQLSFAYTGEGSATIDELVRRYGTHIYFR